MRILKNIMTLLYGGITLSLVLSSALAQESPPKNIPLTNDTVIVVKNVEFDLKKNGIDRVLISLNQPAAITLFALDRDSPKVVVDIQNVLEWKGSQKIPVNGRCVKQLRIHLHKDQKKLRVVMDLVNSAKEYLVSPFYNENTNVYRLEVQEK